MSYGIASPTGTLLADMLTDIKIVANRLVTSPTGLGKVVSVTVLVQFGDGTSIAHEVERTPDP